jgi:Outer membrane protein beta-barrel family/Carboxypeptidase regulatory-like domain
MRFLLSITFFFGFFSSIYAQNPALRGSVRDTLGQPLAFVSVGLLRLSDSSVVSSGSTDEQGQFVLPAVEAGRYVLRARLVGFAPYQGVVTVPLKVPVDVVLRPGANVLGEVTVQEELVPIIVDGDTVTYNAGAFQVRENAVVEDLLKKLPGVEVDRQGNIKAMGQDVRQVLVDGKPFFGNDPKMATKNLPADAIDQVKVYDRRSDQSNFSGFDDGSGEKVIDIRLKATHKRGQFGRFTGGYGTEERFTVNGMLNRFSPMEQVSIMGSANNVNDIGFSPEEMLQSGLLSVNGSGGIADGDGESSGGIMIGGRGGMGNQQAGISRAFTSGFNYWRTVNSRLVLDGNVLLNGSDTRLEQQLWRQNFFPDRTVDFRQQTDNRDRRLNPRLRFEADWKVDSVNSLNLKTNGSFTARNTNDARNYSFALAENNPFLTGLNQLSRDIDRSRAAATLLWKRRFKRKGQTFSTQLQGLIQPGTTFANNDFFDRDTLQQQSNQNDQNNTLSLRSSYTHPLKRSNRFLEMTYAAAYSHYETDKNTLDFDTETQAYNRPNPFFTNGLDYNFFNQQTGLNYRRQRLKYDYGFGLAVQHSHLAAKALTEQSGTNNHFFHLLPNANARFTLHKTGHLRLRLQSAIQAPAARHLFPAPDNTNPQVLRLPNPDLRPEQRYTFQTSYQEFNTAKLSTIMGNASLTWVRDRIASDIVRSETGQQVIRPVNTTAGMTLVGFGVWSRPVIARQLRFSANVTQVLNTGYGFLNGQRNENLLWTKGGGMRWMLELGDRFFLETGGNVNHNYNKNSASFPAVNAFWNVAWESGTEITLPKGWKISADASWNRYLGAATNLNTSFWLLNGSIGKRFLKKEAGFLEIAVNDALNQNTAIERFPGDSYLEEVRNRILRRYFLLKFTYRLAPKGGGSQGQEMRFRF